MKTTISLLLGGLLLPLGLLAAEIPFAADQIALAIAEIANLAVEDVELALTGDPLVKKRDFVKTMQVLVTSRRHL